MISIETKNSYSEVFELLKNTDRKQLQKIPMNLLETIKKNKNESYKPTIDFNNIEDTLSLKAMSLYTWLYIEYISEDIKEKKEIKKILYENEVKKQTNVKLNNELFEKKRDKIENQQMIKYKETFWQKVMKFFDKLKGK